MIEQSWSYVFTHENVHVYTKIHMWIFLSALFSTVKTGNKLKCLSTSEGETKCGTFIERHNIQQNSNGLLIHTTMWRICKSITLNYVCMISFAWNSRKGEILVNKNRGSGCLSLGGQWGLGEGERDTSKSQGGTFLSVGNDLYLECGWGFKTELICQNSSKHTLKLLGLKKSV